METLRISAKDETVLKIPFTLSNGKTFTVSLKDPISNISATDVQTFTDLALGTNSQNIALLVKDGEEVISVGDAYLDRTNIVPLEAATM